ncbi:MAG: type IV pilus modification protein PilV [Pseudomonadota bacterium]
MKRSTFHRRGEQGFTLIEVMIALLVLSIGLLGLAGLQVTALQNNQGAFMRSQATALAYDLADRMRANVLGTISGNYIMANAGADTDCGTATGCTPQAMAQNDLQDWTTSIATYLPLGEGFVCIDSTPGDGANATNPACDGIGTQWAIKIWWDENKDGVITTTATSMERLEISFQP